MNLQTITRGDWVAVINVSRGANCICLRNRRWGSILREPDYAAGELDNPYLYGMPILFPVNRISGGCFVFEGREYRFPISEPNTGCHLHGDLHGMPFEVLAREEDRILCAYRADAAHPYGSFPHAFEIRIAYVLGEDGLTQTTEVINHSEQNMPCMLGFHTTFRLPSADGEEVGASGESGMRVLVELAEEYERNMSNYLPTGVTPASDEVTTALSTGAFDPLSRPISRHYRAGGSGRMELVDTRRGLRVVYENSANLGFRLIYNGDASGFICMEPQTCLVDAPNNLFGRERSGFDAIAPGDRRVYRSAITLAEG